MSQSVLNKITIAECDKFSEAEILFKNCPQDNLAGNADYVNHQMRAKKAALYEIKKEGKAVGFFVLEILGAECCILAMALTEHVGWYQNLVDQSIKRIAINNKCRFISFCTVRPALIKQASENGFSISKVVLRKYL